MGKVKGRGGESLTSIVRRDPKERKNKPGKGEDEVVTEPECLWGGEVIDREEGQH